MSNYTMKEPVESLESLIPHLPKGDHDFAKSLCESFKKKGSLSHKQELWVVRLIIKAEKLKFGHITPASRGRETENFPNIVKFFQQSKLVHPKLFLTIPGAGPIKLIWPPTTSKYYGCVVITDQTPYPKTTWLGFIAGNGKLGGTKKFGFSKVLVEFLAALDHNPKETIAAYGKQTGKCACCGLPLSDDKSLALGIGPVCAKKWNLED